MTRGNVAAVERAGLEPAERDEDEWVRAHRALSRLAQQRARADAEEWPWLLAALRSAAHVHSGFGSFGEYIGHLFGYRPRFTHDKLRVAEALERLPVLARALESGAVHWSALRELTRVATADTEREWLKVACGKNVRQLEALVAGATPGDLPSDRREPGLARRVLRFEVTADTFAVFREAMSHLRRASDARLDDDASLLTMARAVLGGPRDEGRSSYQIALSVCSECGRGAQPAAGESVQVAPEIVAMAWCDAQNLGHLTPAANQNHAVAPDVDEKAINRFEAGPTGPTRSIQRKTQTRSSAHNAQTPANTTGRQPSPAPTNGMSIAETSGSCAHVGPWSDAATNGMSIAETHGGCNHEGPWSGAATNGMSIAETQGSCAHEGPWSDAATNGMSIAEKQGSRAHEGPWSDAATNGMSIAETSGSCAHVGAWSGAATNGQSIAETSGSCAHEGALSGAATNGQSIAETHGGCSHEGPLSGAGTNGQSIAGTQGSRAHEGPFSSAGTNDTVIGGTHGGCNHEGPFSSAATNDTGIAATPGSRAHVGPSARVANVRRPAPAGARVRQSVPPAVRRAVLHRDHHHCRVPGCRNATFLDVHHIRPRCEGGRHVADNLVTLCGVHHRAAHRGALVVEGVSAESVSFRHADGSPYGNPGDAHALDAHSKVFSALRQLGFRESEVRGVMEVLRANVETRALDTRQLLRQALERLGPATRGR